MKDYVAVFSKLKEENPDLCQLYGDYLLVNILKDKEITTPSGIITSTPENHARNSLNSNKPVFCQILLAGKGYSQDGVIVPIAAEPGEVVVVGQNAPLIFTRFGDIPMVKDLQLALIREGEIIMQFPGTESYDAYFEELKKGLNGL